MGCIERQQLWHGITLANSKSKRRLPSCLVRTFVRCCAHNQFAHNIACSEHVCVVDMARIIVLWGCIANIWFRNKFDLYLWFHCVSHKFSVNIQDRSRILNILKQTSFGILCLSNLLFGFVLDAAAFSYFLISYVFGCLFVCLFVVFFVFLFSFDVKLFHTPVGHSRQFASSTCFIV